MRFKSLRGCFRHAQIGVLLGVTAAVLVPTLLVVSPAGATPVAAAKACGATASGAAWKYKGHRGTKYSIVAVNGSRSLCSTAARWMLRLSRNRATLQLKVVPHGWHCAAIGSYTGLAKMGQCTYGHAIIEWLPKVKK
jgi:hypothetical protein